MTKSKKVPYDQKIQVIIIDPNHHSHSALYTKLSEDPKYSVIKFTNIKQVFTHEKFFDSCRLIILTPHMPSYGHYDNDEHGKLTGLFLYRDKFENRRNLKVIVWARTIEEALENWGDNVVRREIIPRKHHFCFHATVEELFK